MYQRYPSSTNANAVEPDRGPAPQSIQNAVKLMYAGAVVSAISFIVSLTTVGSLKTSIHKAEPTWSAHKVSEAATAYVVEGVIFGIIGIGLWIWMARKNGQGRNWARMTASVLFAFFTLNGIAVFGEHGTVFDVAIYVVTWLIGLGAVVMMWRSSSNAYYNSMKEAV
jgi:hypothetical protein